MTNRRRGRPRSWISTTAAAKLLGRSPGFMYIHRTDLFKKGGYWRIVNPHAAKPRYEWNSQKLKQYLEQTIDG